MLSVRSAMRALTDFRTYKKLNHRSAEKKLCPIINLIRIHPEIGKTTETTVYIQGHEAKTLLDSGSPTSFISKKLVKKLGLSIHPALLFTFKGFISATTAKTTKAVSIDIKIEKIRLPLSVYVIDHMDHDLLLGNKVLTKFPEDRKSVV